MRQQRLLAVWAMRAFTAVVGASLVAGSVLASDIYRYTDDDGNVYYVDRPSGAQTEQRLAIPSKPSAYRPPEREDAREGGGDAAPGAGGADDEAPAKKLTRAEKKAAKRQRDQQCQSSRDTLESLTSAPRLFREDENGERVYLDEAESQAARDRAARLVEENCS